MSGTTGVVRPRVASGGARARGDGARQRRQQIGLLFRGLNTGFREAVDDALAAAGIGLPYGPVSTLSLLQFRPGANGAELARAAMVSAQAMNVVLNRLASEGYVERRAHPDNPRADAWYLRAAGEALMARAHGVFDAVVSKMLHGLSRAEVAELERLLGICAASLRGATPEPPT